MFLPFVPFTDPYRSYCYRFTPICVSVYSSTMHHLFGRLKLRVSPLLTHVRYTHSKFTPSTVHLPTVYAMATPPGQKSAIAVIRVSGTYSKYVYHKLTRRKADPKPRTMLLRTLYDTSPALAEKTGLVLDQSLVSFSAAPHSFTGEDTLELYIHGGRAVAEGVLRSIGQLHSHEEDGPQIRYAEAGEFSRRAFQNEKFDLTEVEGIRDLIDAETESQRRSVLSSFSGSNKKLFDNWRSQLVNNVAQLTAVIDFGEDNDSIGSDNLRIFGNVEESVRILKRQVEQFLERVSRAQLLQDGLRVALVGAPNAGKSTLLNMLARDDVSLVSDVPGTTRDAVDRVLDMGGYKVVFSDTAGIRSDSSTSDAIEQMGIGRAEQRAQRSHMCVLVVDASKGGRLDPRLLAALPPDTPLVVVLNKVDLVSQEIVAIVTDHIREQLQRPGQQVLPVSCKLEEGTGALVEALLSSFKELAMVDEHGAGLSVSRRVRDTLTQDVLAGLEQFLVSADLGHDVAMAAEDLQGAIHGIGRITGENVGVEEVLGVVFSTFCVGK